MKKFFILSMLALVLALIPESVMAQHNKEAVISGVVKDSLTNEGELAATIRIYKNGNETPVSMGITDMDGKFEIGVKDAGDYFLKITSVGKAAINQPFSVNNQRQNVALGVLFMQELSENLNELVVVASKPLVKMDVDKIEYSVKDDADSKTNTILEMLRKVPMVTVDGEDNIKVNGSSSFQVYVNGKPNPMMTQNASVILKAMPAQGVKSIDVITNPGAKYDAEGVGGILNITMDTDSNMEGYTATLRGMGGNRLNGGSVYAMVQKDKLTLSLNGNFSHIKMPSIQSEMNRMAENAANSMNYKGETNGHMNVSLGNVDLSYEFDKKNALTASVGLMNTPSHMNINGTTSLMGGAMNYTTNTLNRSRSLSLNGNVDFTHLFGENPQHSLTLTYRISTAPQKNMGFSHYSLDTMPDYDMTDKNNSSEHTLQADYSLPLNEKSTLEAGGKYILRRNSSESAALDYLHKNDIGGVYGSYTLRAGAWGLKAGLRYEHTEQTVNYRRGNGEDFQVSYDNLVPSATLSYKVAPMQNIGLSYNMRISRPGISLLNPYINDQDPQNISFGNSLLDVEKGHNLQLTYSLFGSRFMMNAALQHNFVNNGIEAYTYFKDNVLYTTYDNIGKQNNTSLNLFVNWTVFPDTRLTINSTTTHVDLKSKGMGFQNKGWQQNIMANVQQTLPGNFKLSLMYFGGTPTYSLQGKSSGINIHSVGLTKSLLKDRLSLGLNMINPFTDSMKMTSDTRGNGFSSHSVTKVKMRSVVFTASLSLGNLKPKQKMTNTDSHNESDVKNAENKNMQMNSIFMGN